jgi:surface protein
LHRIWISLTPYHCLFVCRIGLLLSGIFLCLFSNAYGQDIEETFSITGGQFSFPFYNITDSNGDEVDFNGSYKLLRGKTYEFWDEGVSSTHPFMVGESYGDTSSELVEGLALNGEDESLYVTIPADFEGSLYYFCTNHSGMVQQFTIQTGIDNSNFATAVNLWFDDQTQAIDTYGHISDWDVSSVTNMTLAFHNRSSFNDDISGWDVSSVTAMSGMFRNASAFNQDISAWDVSLVTDLNQTFDNAVAFNQDLSGWDVSSAIDMTSMFNGASTFNQDISGWDVSSATRYGQYV